MPLRKPNLQDIPDLYSKVKAATEYILQKHGRFSPEKTMFRTDIIKAILTDFSEERFNEATLWGYIQRAANERTRIACPGFKRGYYLITSGLAEEATAETPGSKMNKRQQREKLLYPFCEDWLLLQGYARAGVLKTMGDRWGTPDVVGISRRENHLVGHYLELATIEVKASAVDWKTLIFEAVSHRRFSNRAYFAFGCPADEENKTDPDLRYYCELFGVGALMILLDNQRYKLLNEGKDLRDLQLSREDVLVKELYSAPYQTVQRRYQLDFVENVLDMKHSDDVIRFGRALEAAG